MQIYERIDYSAAMLSVGWTITVSTINSYNPFTWKSPRGEEFQGGAIAKFAPDAAIENARSNGDIP